MGEGEALRILDPAESPGQCREWGQIPPFGIDGRPMGEGEVLPVFVKSPNFVPPIFVMSYL